ncbi:MAG: beta-ketoacyl synthase, partial [Desulfobacula sp.]|nr:beta-ketoacyl synthase [Desulfobacula sp.]
YTHSLEKALKDAGTSFKDIDIYEACMLGIKEDEKIENRVLNTFCSKYHNEKSCHITSASSAIGNTRGASSLLSVIKTALLLNSRKKAAGAADNKACVASISMDGAFAHTIIEGYQTDTIISGQNQISDSNFQPIQDSNHNSDFQSDLKKDSIANCDLPDLNLEPILDPELIAKGSLATSSAHEKFLEFSSKNMQILEHQFKTLTQLAGKVVDTTNINVFSQKPGIKSTSESKTSVAKPSSDPFLNREQCLEYATGKAGNVLGPDFEIIDTYPVRVRLPDEPLMLVDRIMDIQGEKLSLTSGKIITQHDVKENSWYLDGNKAPVSITIEAGQADLFLCAWLGIDHAVKGTRKYRLLDAKVTFHRTLPNPGETIEYHIEIDRFLKQGDVYLFFFHYKGYIDDQLLISMQDGCAGFFTEQEVEDSGGIILKPEDLKPINIENNFSTLVPVSKTKMSDEKVQALREGNLGKAFGDDFQNKTLGQHLRLPGNRMHLIDRIIEFDPDGGRSGLGSITAEADIHGDEWFLKCHFIDDMVMPGTLMYECCAHALRVFTQRMGWVSDRDDLFYDVVLNNESDLKCRGPVTTKTKKVRYEIEIKEMAYNPEPYVIADAHMFSDDLRIVLYKNMGLKIVGLTENDFVAFWRKQ